MFCLHSEKASALKGKRANSFLSAYTFSEGNLCIRKQTGCLKSCLPCEEWFKPPDYFKKDGCTFRGGKSCQNVCLLSKTRFALKEKKFALSLGANSCRPRWFSWIHRPTGDQEVAGSAPAEVGNILTWRLIMKYFLRSFSSFCWFKKGSCQFLAKECAQYWLTT